MARTTAKRREEGHFMPAQTRCDHCRHLGETDLWAWGGETEPDAIRRWQSTFRQQCRDECQIVVRALNQQEATRG